MAGPEAAAVACAADPPATEDRWSVFGRIPPVRTAASRLAINYYGYATSPRPRALSLASDYTSWQSLTDRTFTGRHLPPATTRPEDLPSEADVTALYRREREIKSTDTSVMFMFFAQWFTDSFLRTSNDDPTGRKNTSNHEIDLCQIYGLDADKTAMLRSHEGGRLKSQLIRRRGIPAVPLQAPRTRRQARIQAGIPGTPRREVLHREDP